MSSHGSARTGEPRRSEPATDPVSLLRERLLDREEQLRTAQEMAEFGIWEWDVEGGTVEWSEQLYEIYGVAAAEYRPSYDGYLKRVHPEDRERVAATIQQALEDHQAIAYDERILRPDGSMRRLLTRGRVIVDGNDRPIRMIGVSQDLTEQREAQSQAAEAEAAIAIAHRLADLQRITEAALTHLSLDELLPELLARICGTLALDNAAVLLMDEDKETLVLRAVYGPGHEELGFRIALGGGFSGRVAAERRLIVIDERAYEEVASPALRESAIESMVGIPLIVRGDVMGVLSVASQEARTFDTDEIALLELAADRAAMAIEHAHVFERERGIAETLQRVLLPAKLPELENMSAAARYVPASEDADIGGDWYDVIPLERGRVGLVLGDVTGHGLEAAALMAQLRHGLRAYALEGLEPGVIADRLDTLIHTPDLERLATLIYAIVDPDLSVEFVNAGHLPPLVVGLRTTKFLETPGGVPIGCQAGESYPTERVQLSPGDVLVLFTDGLIERRGESIEDGLERLRDAAADAPDEPHDLADHLLRALMPGAGGDDDIALLALRVDSGP